MRVTDDGGLCPLVVNSTESGYGTDGAVHVMCRKAYITLKCSTRFIHSKRKSVLSR
jgi:hypothetical protein